MSYNTDTTRILAESEMKEGHFDRALQLFQSIVERDSNNPEIWFRMAACKLYNLAVDPLQYYKGNKQAIEVAFQYFARSIDCFGYKVFITNPNDTGNQSISNSNSNSNNITIAEKNALSVAFQVIEALRAMCSSEAKNANQNFDTAKKHAMQAGATRMMGILNPQNNMYNNAFQANFAMQNENTAHNLHQQYQTNLQAIEKINEITQNVKDATKHFISNLNGFFSQEEFDDFDWKLLSETEKNAKKRELVNKLIANQRVRIDALLGRNKEYKHHKENAEFLFNSKKYSEAIEAASTAFKYFDDIKNGALGDDYLYAVYHNDLELQEIINSSNAKIKSRHKTFVWLSVLLCIAVFICLFCI